MKKNTLSLQIAEKTFILETGSLAGQATSSVLARLGDTMVLVTVVEGKVREDLGYFPLSVEFVERLYAGGRIKGSRWVKREGRPTDDAILTARLIDRSIRPLFPKEYKNEVQVVSTVLSVDGENEADVLSIIAVSAALQISKIPWKGPVGAVRMGYMMDGEKGKFVVNPTSAEIKASLLDIVTTGSKEKTLMLEAGGLQVGEDVAILAIEQAQGYNKVIVEGIEGWAKEIGVKKTEVSSDPILEEIKIQIEKTYKAELAAQIPMRATKESTGGDSEELHNRIFEGLKAENPEKVIDKKLVAKAIEYVFFKAIREDILKNGKRPDGRKVDEIRPISGMVGLLPRTHGSAIFQRGTTQALTVVTLGSPRMEQLIESADGEESKRYIHHYSMPPYSVGEAGRMGTPSRREIGHGALAERAVMAVIPSSEKFPYTIRVVSEILSSNGSTSMASTCGSIMALMDAGVPITAPVAGIAMGLVTDGDKFVILTDILGLEDFSGDMDFKVAGTQKGITAIQLDVKIAGLTLLQIKDIFEKAKAGRVHILGKMNEVISQVRDGVSAFAPKIEQVTIPVEKIGELIGPGGRMIKSIIATTGAQVDVEDDGKVTISGTDAQSVQKATEWVKNLTREVLAGEEFEGEVKRILPFGAFVEILPGKEGMVHVSKMSTGFVKNPEDIVKIGQMVKVRVAEIDDMGRINLSMIFGNEAEGIKDRTDFPSQAQPFVPTQPYTPVTVRPAVEEHPLSRQFKRERSAVAPRFGGRPSGPSRPRSGFRKTHY